MINNNRLHQSFQNFEIIIVNDYSNDTTKDIIKRLQLKDNRIKIINLPTSKIKFYYIIYKIREQKGKSSKKFRSIYFKS